MYINIYLWLGADETGDVDVIRVCLGPIGMPACSIALLFQPSFGSFLFFNFIWKVKKGWPTSSDSIGILAPRVSYCELENVIAFSVTLY